MDAQLRTFIIAFDVTIPRGVHPFAQDALEAVRRLVDMPCDALLLHSGLARQAAGILAGKKPFIAKLTTATLNSADMTRRVMVDTVEHALSLGAVGVAVNLFIGAAYEEQMLVNLTSAVEACDRLGMPLIAMANPMPEHQFDGKQLAYVCRVAAELGADVVKTDYPGSPEQFERIRAACPVPVLVEESPYPEDAEGTLQTAREAMDCGGAGVMFANRIWGQESPRSLAGEVLHIVHR